MLKIGVKDPLITHHLTHQFHDKDSFGPQTGQYGEPGLDWHRSRAKLIRPRLKPGALGAIKAALEMYRDRIGRVLA